MENTEKRFGMMLPATMDGDAQAIIAAWRYEVEHNATGGTPAGDPSWRVVTEHPFFPDPMPPLLWVEGPIVARAIS